MAKGRRKSDKTNPDATAPDAPRAARVKTAHPTKSAPEDTAVAGDSERERVARRAYEIYQSRATGDDRALDDWLSAEKELAGERPARGSVRTDE